MNNEEEVLAEDDEMATALADADKLNLKVDIEDIGPCKKHISVTISREDIDALHDMSVEELSAEAQVPGFRTGKVPAKLIEKRFKDEIFGQLKQKLLMQSMEQVSEENGLEPIGEPDIEVESLEIPDEGDFEYEFEIEVRPDFEMPDFSKVKIERKTSEVTDDDVEAQLKDFLAQYGTFVPHDGPAELGDYLVVDMKFTHGDEVFKEMEEVAVELRSTLRFQDAELEDFGKLMDGAKPDEERETKITISVESPNVEMRGEELGLAIKVQDVKKVEMPEIDEAMLERLGVESEDDLKKQIRESLERQTTYEQRESTRDQLLAQITESASWDLPEDLVSRQADNALRREILEMRQAGFTQQQIAARENQTRQQSLTKTRDSLKQHFILDKLAEDNGIEVPPSKIDMEIQMMAWQSGESARKVRARMVKNGMIENLEAQIREQLAIDHVLEKVTFVDIPGDRPDPTSIATVNRLISENNVVETTVEDDEEAAEE